MNDSNTPRKSSKAPSEKHLEDWIVANPHLVHGEVTNLTETPIPDEYLSHSIDLGNDNVAWPLFDHIIARQPRWPVGHPDLIVKTSGHYSIDGKSVAAVELKLGNVDIKALTQCVRYMAGLKEIMAYAQLQSDKPAKFPNRLYSPWINDYPEGEITGVLIGHGFDDKHIPILCAYSNITLVLYDYHPSDDRYTFESVFYEKGHDVTGIYKDWGRGAIGKALLDVCEGNAIIEERRRKGRQ